MCTPTNVLMLAVPASSACSLSPPCCCASVCQFQEAESCKCSPSFPQAVCSLSRLDLTPCCDGVTTELHLDGECGCECVCAHTCGSRDSSAPETRVSLTFVDLSGGHSEVGPRDSWHFTPQHLTQLVTKAVCLCTLSVQWVIGPQLSCMQKADMLLTAALTQTASRQQHKFNQTVMKKLQSPTVYVCSKDWRSSSDETVIKTHSKVNGLFGSFFNMDIYKENSAFLYLNWCESGADRYAVEKSL